MSDQEREFPGAVIRLEAPSRKGEITMHVNDQGIRQLRDALDNAEKGNKVFMGKPGEMFIIRPEGFSGNEGFGDG